MPELETEMMFFIASTLPEFNESEVLTEEASSAALNLETSK